MAIGLRARAGNAVMDFCKEVAGVKNCARIVQVISKWKQELCPSSEDIKLIEATDWIKQFCSIVELPGKVSKVFKRAKQLPPFHSQFFFEKERSIPLVGAKLVVDLSKVHGALCDSFKFITRVHPIDHVAIRALQQTSCGVEFVGASVGAGLNIKKIVELQDGPGSQPAKTGLHLLRLATNVLGVALGALGLAGAILGVAVSAQLILALITASLALGLSAHFYERIVDPNMRWRGRPV